MTTIDTGRQQDIADGRARKGAGLYSLAITLVAVVVFAGLTGAALALNLRYGLTVFAERLISGVAGCF
ncbi:hypothetical protein [Methylobrevis pamukkalensis]|uniref:Uncharacterized protein n=1 Tax=Methylobrevis pamukkalensis TaxID=1439726 RepID=A0A1E3H6V5_9HYPH|nr:hypothetical protein [Methylobrevis pamukkalensis]ODN72067.1 hypothetical protein A6302_00582 [Methylobrevis pamukkalensis]